MTEFLKYIESDSYRKWLEENSDKLDWYDYMQLILCARADIRDKLPDLIKLRDSIDEADVKIKGLLDELNGSIEALKKAINLMTEASSETIFIYEFGYIDKTDAYEKGYCCATPHKTFKQAMEEIVNETEEEEYDENELSWNSITRYDIKDGDYEETASYIVGHNGVIWTATVDGMPSKEVMDNFFVDMCDLNLITPYKPGDIITIDCRPYQEPFHAVITWKGMASDRFEDCCSPCALFVKDGSIVSRGIKHLYLGPDAFSPLLRIEKFEGELPEHEKIVGDVSEYIRTHEDGAKKIDEINFDSYSPKAHVAEETLKKLIYEI